MERERVIFLVEEEIKDLEAAAKSGGFFAKDNLETAHALREMLAVYIQEPFVFREHWIRGTRPMKARRRR